MKQQSLSLTRRGILWFHWGLEASAGLILISFLLTMFMMSGARWMAIPLGYYGRIALVLAPIAQAVMICGVIMTTAAPRESRATRWASLTLLAGIGASAFTIALYSFRWPLQWAVATWPLLFIQGLLMTRYLALISGWILKTERLDLAKAKEQRTSADLNDVKTWSNIRDRFDGLLHSGIFFLIVVSLFGLLIRFFGGTIYRTHGVNFFIVTVIASLVAVLWASFLLMRFSRSVYYMKLAFQDSTDRPSDADARWDHVAPDRMKPLGIAMGVLAIVAIGGDLWSKHYLLPEYVKEQMAEFRERSKGRYSTTAAVGKPAPEMAMKTIDGESILLSEQRGRPVLLNFWATWCRPCIAEMPDLVRLAGESDTEGLVVIGISKEPARTLKRFVQKNEINFPIVSGSGWDAPFDKIAAVPTSYVIDREGVIRNVFVGARNYDDFKAAVLDAIRTPAEKGETASDDAETENAAATAGPGNAGPANPSSSADPG